MADSPVESQHTGRLSFLADPQTRVFFAILGMYLFLCSIRVGADLLSHPPKRLSSEQILSILKRCNILDSGGGFFEELAIESDMVLNCLLDGEALYGRFGIGC